MLQLQEINKRFGRTLVVDNLNIEVPKGSVFGLLGPNGAGKTTTIRMIMNIIKPDSGQILYRGTSLNKEVYKKIGYLPEERGLYQKMKLRETMVFLAGLKGLSKSRAEQSALKYLDRFELLNYSERKIEKLSKGNQQKVQFIISIIHKPELIILDEPFVGLDPLNQLLLKKIINELCAEGRTVIFSTHQMEQVEKLCEKICLINKGQIVLYGDLKEIKKKYGAKIVKIEYNEREEHLSDLKTIENFTLGKNSISGEIKNGIALNEVLAEVMNLVNITHFHIEEASLEQIFINQVRGV